MVCCDGYLKWKNRRKYILLIFRLHYCTRLGSSMFNSKWSKVWMLEVDRLSVTSCWYKLYSVVCSKESSGIYERIYKTWWNKGTFFTWRRYISVIWITNLLVLIPTSNYMFKVNNKFCCLYSLLWTYFTPYFSVVFLLLTLSR